MPSSYDKTASVAATIVDCWQQCCRSFFSVVFFCGSSEQLGAFRSRTSRVFIRKRSWLVVEPNKILEPIQNALCWRLARFPVPDVFLFLQEPNVRDRKSGMSFNVWTKDRSPHENRHSGCPPVAYVCPSVCVCPAVRRSAWRRGSSRLHGVQEPKGKVPPSTVSSLCSDDKFGFHIQSVSCWEKKSYLRENHQL